MKKYCHKELFLAFVIYFPQLHLDNSYAQAYKRLIRIISFFSRLGAGTIMLISNNFIVNEDPQLMQQLMQIHQRGMLNKRVKSSKLIVLGRHRLRISRVLSEDVEEISITKATWNGTWSLTIQYQSWRTVVWMFHSDVNIEAATGRSRVCWCRIFYYTMFYCLEYSIIIIQQCFNFWMLSS